MRGNGTTQGRLALLLMSAALPFTLSAQQPAQVFSLDPPKHHVELSAAEDLRLAPLLLPVLRSPVQRPRPTPAARWGTLLNGGASAHLAGPGAKAAVLYFVASDCPVSNRSFPEMLRVRDLYQRRGVAFWFVYPNATEETRAIRAHQAEYAPGTIASVLRDPSSTLTRLAGAHVTPEAAVLVPEPDGGWRPVYVGRVDDRFVRIGVERAAPTVRLVDRALAQVLAGETVTPDPGAPVGCAIVTSRAAKL